MYEINTNIILMENTNKKLKAYLKDDLKALEYHTNELINNIYARGQQKEFKTDIETIEEIFSYWSHHLKQL